MPYKNQVISSEISIANKQVFLGDRLVASCTTPEAAEAAARLMRLPNLNGSAKN